MNIKICNFILKSAILNLGVHLFVTNSVLGQKIDFTGHWLLEERVHLKGPDYSNGLPSQVKIEQDQNIMTIFETTASADGNETRQYSVKLDGTPLQTNTPRGNTETKTIRWNSNGNGLIETITYVRPNEHRPYHISLREWRMTNIDDMEIMQKDEYDSSVNTEHDESFSMKGRYGRLGAGINFVNGLSWKQIQAKAKNEGKYIFVDCYASWCMPCKKMDQEIYPLIKVSDFMNTYFISVKLQMDTTKHDSELVRERYADAHYLLNQYGVPGYPTFLFFSPEGKILHRDLGYQQPNEFLNLVKAALSPTSQYYTMLENYKQGKKNYKNLSNLALTTESLGNKDLAWIIAQDYKNNYIDQLSEQQLLDKDLIEFVTRQFGGRLYYVDESHGKFFELFYHQGAKVDSVMSIPGYAKMCINNLIRVTEIYNKIWHDNKPIKKVPNWKLIYSDISKKYNVVYAENLVSSVQLNFYGRTKNWKSYAKKIDELIKKYPPKKDGKDFMRVVGDIFDDTWALNTTAWNIFTGCDDKLLLRKALGWAEMSIKLIGSEIPDSKQGFLDQVLDTKANLLYKLGNVSEAIVCEEKAAKIINDKKQSKGGVASQQNAYRETADKMKKGLPTWEHK